MTAARAGSSVIGEMPEMFGELGSQSCALLDQSASERTPLSFVWTDLVSGRFRVHACFFSELRSFLVLRPEPLTDRVDRRLSARKVRVLERILLGEGQKAVALSLSVAPSTVTLLTGECLRAMGLDCGTSRIPSPLVMAAYAAKGLTNYRHGTLSDVIFGDRQFRVIGLPRPDVTLPERLSRNEVSVVRSLVEGKCHAEIARAQDKSQRTVANQLASAFHKLEVSGRAELLSRLIARPERARARNLRAL